MKKKIYNERRAKGEVHDLLRKRGPRFSIQRDRSKDPPRKRKYDRSNKIYRYS